MIGEMPIAVQPYKADLCHDSCKQRRIEVQHIPLSLSLSFCFESSRYSFTALQLLLIVFLMAVDISDTWIQMLLTAFSGHQDTGEAKHAPTALIPLLTVLHITELMQRELLYYTADYRTTLLYS